MTTVEKVLFECDEGTVEKLDDGSVVLRASATVGDATRQVLAVYAPAPRPPAKPLEPGTWTGSTAASRNTIFRVVERQPWDPPPPVDPRPTGPCALQVEADARAAAYSTMTTIPTAPPPARPPDGELALLKAESQVEVLEAKYVASTYGGR